MIEIVEDRFVWVPSSRELQLDEPATPPRRQDSADRDS